MEMLSDGIQDEPLIHSLVDLIGKGETNTFEFVLNIITYV